ncbi:MAG: DUF5615 family PIN-like protein [bacterium]|nr:DUF5615 family PIN-like protein [bacterium]
MFALLVDEDFDGNALTVIENVAEGYETSIQTLRVVDIAELGVGTSDRTILEFAAEHDLVVITQDRQTMPDSANQLMEEGLLMAGMIVVSRFSVTSAVAHAVIEKHLERERDDLGWHYQIEWL